MPKNIPYGGAKTAPKTTPDSVMGNQGTPIKVVPVQKPSKVKYSRFPEAIK